MASSAVCVCGKIPVIHGNKDQRTLQLSVKVSAKQRMTEPNKFRSAIISNFLTFFRIKKKASASSGEDGYGEEANGR